MKSPTTTIAEALVSAADNRDRALQNLRNAVALSEEDASINRDRTINGALGDLMTAEQALHSRTMDATAICPPAWGTIGTRSDVLDGAPGTEEPLPEDGQPGDPVPQGDPSVPKRDKIAPPPAEPSEAEAA